MRAWLGTDRGRSWLWALGCYIVLLGIYALVAGEERLTEHTPYNHFALQAQAWLRGHLDLGRHPPDYAQGNDFAFHDGKWYVPFPALPAALLLPLVYFAGGAERVRDAQVFVWLAPIGPVLLFLVLEKLRRRGRSERPRWQNLALAVSFALGSVYFFTAVQGSVWFAAHVVAVALAAAYVLAAIGAERPFWAGLFVGLGFWARAPLLFAVPFFVFEVLRACRRASAPSAERHQEAGAAPLWRRMRDTWHDIDGRRCARAGAWFAAPLSVCFVLSLAHNQARFGDPFEVGYRYLQIAWQGRIERWGLFHYHYLAKNLGVVLTSLPWVDPLRINLHGLALWITTPAYLYLVWPGSPRPGFAGLLLAAACTAVPTLFYQNTGWMQFGYRFSNDYAVFLFVALALTGRRFGPFFWALSLCAIAVNAFGAVTFDRAEYGRFYYQQPSQETLYQPN